MPLCERRNTAAREAPVSMRSARPTAAAADPDDGLRRSVSLTATRRAISVERRSTFASRSCDGVSVTRCGSPRPATRGMSPHPLSGRRLGSAIGRLAPNMPPALHIVMPKAKGFEPEVVQAAVAAGRSSAGLLADNLPGRYREGDGKFRETSGGGASMAQQGEKVTKTDAEWRRQLTPEQYAVTRHKATERPFSGEYEHTATPGTYRCVCCGAELFESDAKFDSG